MKGDIECSENIKPHLDIHALSTILGFWLTLIRLSLPTRYWQTSILLIDCIQSILAGKYTVSIDCIQSTVYGEI